MGDKGINYVQDFWIEDERNDLLSVPGKNKRKAKNKKMEFVGWGSKPLINFLKSICKDTSTKISPLEAENIIKDYIMANNLTDPHKKKRILCDERLFSLFGKKSFSRIKIREFVEKHFAENISDSDDDFLYSSEENDEQDKKRQKTALKSIGKANKKVKETPKSCYVAIIPANIKLLYLKRRLVVDLYKDEETFETKVVGSFVRIKSNPNDYLQKNSHQLLLVNGVKKPCGAGTSCSDILLEVSNAMDDIRICMLSDDNFSEEECEDLHERIKSGSLKRPLTVEFQEKAELLHADITKHWLERELHLLQNLIDRANEKGWRKELFEYLERRELIKSPEEQKRLILEVPKVIAEELELEAKPDEEIIDSPKQPLLGTSSTVSTDNSLATQTLATQDIKNIKAPDFSSLLGMSSVVSANNSVATQTLATQDLNNMKSPENRTQVQWVEENKTVHIPEITDKEDEKEESFSVDLQQQKKAEAKFSQTPHMVTFSVDQKQQKKLNFLQTHRVVTFSVDQKQQKKVDFLQNPQKAAISVDQNQQKKVEAKFNPTTQIVELSDDDREEKEEDTRTMMWHYVDPQGKVQGPFDLETLKRWSDAKYFPPDFKVFQKTGQMIPVLLSQLLAFLLLK